MCGVPQEAMLHIPYLLRACAAVHPDAQLLQLLDHLVDGRGTG